MDIQYQTRRFYPDLYGGLEHVGVALVRQWRQQGHRVSVLTENYPDGPMVADEPVEGVPCVRIPTAGRGRWWRVAPWARVLSWARHNWRYGRKAQTTICAYPECVVARKMAFPNRKVVYFCIGFSNAARANGLPRVNGQQLLLERLAAMLADRIAVESQLARTLMQGIVRLPNHKVVVVPHGVDLVRFAGALPCDTMASLKAGGCFVVVFLGRLYPYKGADLALRAVAAMRNRARTRLVIVGEGPERPSLETETARMGLSDNVLFQGKVGNPEVYLAGADVLVSPSRMEMFGNVVLEAMAAGVPCVTWQADYPRVPVASSENVVHGQTGYCVPAFDTDRMAQCLDELAENPDLRTRMGQAAQSLCRGKFSWSLMAEMILSLASDREESHGRGGRGT